MARNATGPGGPLITLVETAFAPEGAHVVESGLDVVYTPTCPPHATMALVQAFTQNVRYTLDGTPPTASVGFRLTAGDAPTIIPYTNLTTLQFIEEVAGAVLQLQWGF